MTNARFELRPVATIQSPLTDLAAAPKQAHEGAPEAWIVFDAGMHDALDGLRPGDDVVVLTWLHRSDREVLRVHPRGDVANPIQGVFSTRSPARPNPIGLHEVRILEIDGPRMRVSALEAIDGTPVLDVKPVLRPASGELEATVDDIKSELDALSEMGEAESLRLQMAMDRLSKLTSALSNILKKSSDTSGQITQNLK